MNALRLEHIRKSFGRTEVLNDVSLDVQDGEFLVFVGPSGCGKSTLLRIIAGLEVPDSGHVRIGGEPVDHLPPAKRGIAMVFQTYALYPHLSVRGNMELGLKQAGTARSEIDRRIVRAAEMLHLEELLDRRPAGLSGGQRQRVAIGRAIVRQPKLFLFDEPLSNIDDTLRVDTRMEIAGLHRRLGTATVYVTHDQVEAMTLADRVAVLNQGRVEQIGRPIDLYRQPANRFVAGFIGSPRMNFIEDPAITAHFKAHSIGIRPEHLAITFAEPDLMGTVSHTEQLGSDTFVYVRTEEVGLLTVRAPGEEFVTLGDEIGLSVDERMVHRFDHTGKALGDG